MFSFIVLLKIFWLVSLCTGFAPEFCIIIGIYLLVKHFKDRRG